MKSFKLKVHAVAVVLLMAVAGQVCAQQAFPTKPIRLIAPYPPGGGTDLVARVVGQKLAEGLGQAVIVDNRPGGNTMIGSDVVAKAQPDGYTLELAASTHVLVPLFFKAPSDAIKVFAAVGSIARSEYVLLVNPAVPANNLKELIAYAKSRPGQLNYATPAAGGTNHLVHEVLNLQAGMNTQHIPYKGSGPALAALVSGEVQLHFSTTGPTVPFINSGRLRAIAVTGDTRLAALPNVPTFAEAGLPGISKLGSFYGILTTAGTPKLAIDRLSAELAKSLAQPDLQEKLLAQGLVPFISTPEQFDALLKERLADNADIIKKANIKLEN
jgi:tripartite-type tricarboxylate transporter receptor subunit TctC